jgi:hypothetical protein
MVGAGNQASPALRQSRWRKKGCRGAIISRMGYAGKSRRCQSGRGDLSWAHLTFWTLISATGGQISIHWGKGLNDEILMTNQFSNDQ